MPYAHIHNVVGDNTIDWEHQAKRLGRFPHLRRTPARQLTLSGVLSAEDNAGEHNFVFDRRR